MAIKKRPVSPRQKMINLMYVVLMAMLALNVSNEVLNGFAIVGESIGRTTDNAIKDNMAIYEAFEEQMKANPQKVKEWYEKAQLVRQMSDSLYDFAAELKLAIAREADGKDGDPDNLKGQEDLEASNQVMLAPGRGKGEALKLAIESYRERILKMIPDTAKQRNIASDLTTEVPPGKRSTQCTHVQSPCAASACRASYSSAGLPVNPGGRRAARLSRLCWLWRYEGFNS